MRSDTEYHRHLPHSTQVHASFRFTDTLLGNPPGQRFLCLVVLQVRRRSSNLPYQQKMHRSQLPACQVRHVQGQTQLNSSRLPPIFLSWRRYLRGSDVLGRTVVLHNMSGKVLSELGLALLLFCRISAVNGVCKGSLCDRIRYSGASVLSACIPTFASSSTLWWNSAIKSLVVLV